jgi:hypothetical protein
MNSYSGRCEKRPKRAASSSWSALANSANAGKRSMPSRPRHRHDPLDSDRTSFSILRERVSGAFD